jgi:Protein of unknown function (DUF2971)
MPATRDAFGGLKADIVESWLLSTSLKPLVQCNCWWQIHALSKVRPVFDQERHDHASRTSEMFHGNILGIEHPPIQGRSMVGLATESAFGFGDQLHQRFLSEIATKFRVLSLSKNSKSVLMWGHYAWSHKGIALGIDPITPGFYHGLREDGFEIRYSAERDFRLPLAWYRNPIVEVRDFQGNIINSPDELVESSGGVPIPFREYRRQVEWAFITALTTKALDWHYEQEIRYIYDLSQQPEQLPYANGLHFVGVPAPALREIIVGFCADPALVSGIVSLYRQGRIRTPSLFISRVPPLSLRGPST